jgi:transcription elongation factor GreA
MVNYISKEGLEKLKKELEYLQNNKRKELAARLKHAISFGDLKENFAYQEAKDEQGFLEKRILELKKLINSAIVIDKKIGDRVEIGSVVTIKSKSRKETYTIVSPPEANPSEGKISCQSPLGKMMIGRKVGDSFDFQTQEGKIKYTIDKIE